MGDYGFNWIRVLAGLLLSTALLVLFYTTVIRNYLDFDLTGHSMVQTRSGVYNHGFTLGEMTGENIQGRIFTPAHIVMFPIVDAHIYFDSQIPNTRTLRIYDKMRLNNIDTNMVPFSVRDNTYPPNNLPDEPNIPVWGRSYAIGLQSVSNRIITINSFLSNSTPNPAGVVNGDLNWEDLVSLSGDEGGWFGIVSGRDFPPVGRRNEGTSDWLLFFVEQNDRLLVPNDPDPELIWWDN